MATATGSGNGQRERAAGTGSGNGSGNGNGQRERETAKSFFLAFGWRALSPCALTRKDRAGAEDRAVTVLARRRARRARERPPPSDGAEGQGARSTAAGVGNDH